MSTATADVVIKALANPKITHLFGNTTLEFPMTIDYAERYRKNHPLAEFRIAKNTDQNFYEVCKEIGPPARMMRWCCSMFKTGPITRVLNRKFGDKQILTFYGIRKNESVSRSKYSRVTENTETVKIQKQTVASPIFEWKDLDVWLYLLSEKVDFNDAYRLGYDRVGCWCCPNNNLRAQFLSRIYMSERSEKWRLVERLNGNYRDFCLHVQNQRFVNQLSAKLGSKDSKRNEHIQKTVVKSACKLVDF